MPKNLRKYFIIFPFSLVSCIGQMPIVGMDTNGRLIDQKLKKSRYISGLSKNIELIRDHIFKSENLHDEDIDWEVDVIKVGIELEASGGIGPFSVGGGVGIKLTFVEKQKVELGFLENTIGTN